MHKNSVRAVQYFSDGYLKSCKKIPLDGRLKYLEELRRLNFASERDESVLISLRIGAKLLKAFQAQARRENRPYQSKIKDLMREYLGLGTA